MQSALFPLRIAICDDDPAMLDQLDSLCRRILSDTYALEVTHASSLKEFQPSVCSCQIALLDVQLVEECGMDIARELLSRNPDCRIIFVSGYLDSVSQVYEVPHDCFILKTQLEKYLPVYLTRAAGQVAEEAGQRLSFSCGRTTEVLPLSRIVYIERNVHRTLIFTDDGQEFVTREKLSSLLGRIGNSGFLRCHVSYIVNLRHAVDITGHCFLMRTGDLVTISRPNEKAAKDAFFQFISHC